MRRVTLFGLCRVTLAAYLRPLPLLHSLQDDLNLAKVAGLLRQLRLNVLDRGSHAADSLLAARHPVIEIVSFTRETTHISLQVLKSLISSGLDRLDLNQSLLVKLLVIGTPTLKLFDVPTFINPDSQSAANHPRKRK